MSQIHDLPPERDFGLEFNYAMWSGKNSYASLHNVNWNADYRDVAYFNSTNDLNAFLDKQPKREAFDFSYLKPNQPVTVNIPFNVAYEYNYLRVWNFEQPVDGDNARWLYYFITDVQYVSPNATRLVVQLDVWQTFSREIEFGNSYIEQGHIGIANDVSTDMTGARFLTVPEGLDLGGDYQVIRTAKHQIASAVAGSNPTNPNYNVMLVSNVDLEADPGDLDNPKLKSATGSMMENLPNGSAIYVFKNLGDFLTYADNISETPWVSQGIVSITIVPFVLNMTDWPVVKISGVDAYKPDWGSIRDSKRVSIDFRGEVMNALPVRYHHLHKFTTFPYCALEVSTYGGTPLVLKPELWDTKYATFVEKFHLSPPSPRMAILPLAYNTTTGREVRDGAGNITNDNGEFFNVAAFISNFPQFSILNNGYLTTMAAQAHGIAQEYRNADWSQNRTMTGNQLSYDQNTAGMSLANNLNQMQVSAAYQTTNLANQTQGFRSIQSAANSIIGGIGNRDFGTAAMGAANAAADYAIATNQNTQQNAISTNLSRQSNAAQVSNQGYMRDTNKNYADWAAKGDYQNQIASINAKVQDAKLTQPSASGTVGGDAFMLAQYMWGYDLKVKLPNRGAIEVIGEYWLRYGYAVRRFAKMPKDYKCMENFTYWKLKEAYIISSKCPEPFKQALRGIFEKGVTVWHKPELIGNIDIGDNAPITKTYFTQVKW